jgi:DNA-binding response OmpR family regulator
MKSILIIDDDTKINELLCQYLTKNNFLCESEVDPKNGLVKLRNQHYDLVILDIMLPEIDGFDVLKEIRKTNEIPVIMLTARGEVTDKIVGLELGADDYVPKPFEPRELLARIQSVLRRSSVSSAKTELIEFKELIVDPNRRAAYLINKDLELTSTEFELLMLFVTNNGKVLSRDEIMKKTKGISWMSYDRSVDVMVSRLRSKLSSDPRTKWNYIKTVHSVGYIFFAEPK